jgi:hypothetical protein
MTALKISIRERPNTNDERNKFKFEVDERVIEVAGEGWENKYVLSGDDMMRSLGGYAYLVLGIKEKGRGKHKTIKGMVILPARHFSVTDAAIIARKEMGCCDFDFNYDSADESKRFAWVVETTTRLQNFHSISESENRWRMEAIFSTWKQATDYAVRGFGSKIGGDFQIDVSVKRVTLNSTEWSTSVMFLLVPCERGWSSTINEAPSTERFIEIKEKATQAGAVFPSR